MQYLLFFVHAIVRRAESSRTTNKCSIVNDSLTHKISMSRQQRFLTFAAAPRTLFSHEADVRLLFAVALTRQTTAVARLIRTVDNWSLGRWLGTFRRTGRRRTAGIGLLFFFLVLRFRSRSSFDTSWKSVELKSYSTGLRDKKKAAVRQLCCTSCSHKTSHLLCM